MDLESLDGAPVFAVVAVFAVVVAVVVLLRLLLDLELASRRRLAPGLDLRLRLAVGDERESPRPVGGLRRGIVAIDRRGPLPVGTVVRIVGGVADIEIHYDFRALLPQEIERLLAPPGLLLERSP